MAETQGSSHRKCALGCLEDLTIGLDGHDFLVLIPSVQNYCLCDPNRLGGVGRPKKQILELLMRPNGRWKLK
jgi:hypothetical protein